MSQPPGRGARSAHDGLVMLLVPSPLLGPATWRRVEDWLCDRGQRVHVVDFGTGPRHPDQVTDAVVAAARAADEPVVLVPHSNAGYYAPHIATAADVRMTVYVDAALPMTAAGDVALAPATFLDFLGALADEDGLLPPWTQWWDDLDGLFPDAAARRAVEREQPRLSLDYFTSRVPVPAGWSERPSAYLAFGDTYAEERRFAQRAGWPTITLDGGHLHVLHDPARVGAALLELSRAGADELPAQDV